MAQSANKVRITAACDGYFQFKVSDNLVGSTVEIFDEANQLVTSHPIRAKKTTLDFFESSAGTYTIVIKSNDFRVSFRYILCETRSDYISITNPLPLQDSTATHLNFATPR